MSVYIEEYTARSFVVRGETRDHKDTLKSMGGKWNGRLTDKSTNQKFGAWLFWTDKFDEVQAWIDDGCKSVNNVSNQSSDNSNEKIDAIYAMLTAICNHLEIEVPKEPKADVAPKKKVTRKPPAPKKEVVVSVDDPSTLLDSSDEEDDVPVRRLLKKN